MFINEMIVTYYSRKSLKHF